MCSGENSAVDEVFKKVLSFSKFIGIIVLIQVIIMVLKNNTIEYGVLIILIICIIIYLKVCAEKKELKKEDCKIETKK